MPSSARLYAGLGTGAVAVGGLGYIGLVDPHQPGSLYPGCPFKMLTGLNCPACGGLRMTHDLLHGDLAAAAADNVFLLVGLPLVALWWVWRRRIDRPAFPRPPWSRLLSRHSAGPCSATCPGSRLSPAGYRSTATPARHLTRLCSPRDAARQDRLYPRPGHRHR
jgi:hypothetical protein